MSLLELRGVGVGYEGAGGVVEAVRDVDLVLERGEVLGLVGESGSGKSTLAAAILRHLPARGRLLAGELRFDGEDLYALAPAALRDYWRRRARLVPQDPLPSLNPSQRVGRQVAEALDGDGGALRRVHELFESVGLPDPERIAGAYPFELSGGQQQRVMIAMALGGRPDLLVLDEPTTNLDVTTEAAVLDLVRALIRERGTAVLFVSHSLGVVAGLCDRVAVLYAGELVETAPVAELYERPLHPYTEGLLDSVPRIGQDRRRRTLRPIEGRLPGPGERPGGCVFRPRCPLAIERCLERPALEPADGPERRARCWRWPEIARREADPRQPAPPPRPAPPAREATEVLEVRGLEKRFPVRRSIGALLRGAPPASVRALAGVDLEVRRGRTVGLVGESGSGKSTLARAVIGLGPATGGELELLDLPLAPRLEARPPETLRALQMVFQNSDEALNPYLSVAQTLRRPLRRLAGLSRREAEARIPELLEAVQLPAGYAARRPDQLSGGEKQRVAVARAFAARPELLLFDESVSGLDVSVQAAILNLLAGLQEERGTAYVFISHDLAVVSYLADVIAVIYLGRLMQVGPARAVLEPPYHPYTEALLSAVPVVVPGSRRGTIRLEGEVPSPVDVPTGCPFHTRCPRVLGPVCREETPPWHDDGRGGRIFCHIPPDELAAVQERVFTFDPDAPSIYDPPPHRGGDG